jgi:hypothetical protein
MKKNGRNAPVVFPYVTVKGFTLVMALLKKTKVGKRIDKDYLETRGIPKNAIYPSLSAMRFFGLINQNGEMVSSARDFVRNRRKRADVIHEKYKLLYGKLDLPAESRSTIMQTISQLSPIGEKLLPFCTTFFIWASKEAGDVPLKQVPKRVAGRRGRRRGRKPGAAWRRTPAAASVPAALPAPITFQLTVDRATTRDQIKRMITDVRIALQES